MIAFEAISAKFGDCLLVHDGASPPGFLWLIDGGPDCVLDTLMRRLKELAASPPPPRITWGMVSHIDEDHILGIDLLLARLLSATERHRPKPVTIDRFWFNSFSALVGGNVPSATMGEATPQDVAASLPAGLLSGDEHADAIVQSVPQGESVTASLLGLRLADNAPFTGVVQAPKVLKRPIDGARITVLGPSGKRLEALRKAWRKAVGEPDETARNAALQELFLPRKSLDTSVWNLSSIVVLAEFAGGGSLMLTGDARGDHIVEAWQELHGQNAPVKPVDILKAPHHGSARGFTRAFLDTFPARHYVFSADGRHGNPDASVVEAVVTTQRGRDIALHFTNGAITWRAPYTMESTGRTVQTLDALIAELKQVNPRATYRSRVDTEPSIRIDLT